MSKLKREIIKKDKGIEEWEQQIRQSLEEEKEKVKVLLKPIQLELFEVAY